MKKIVFMILTLMSITCCNFVNAESIYYTNNNGVNFTEKQYRYIEKMFDKEYIDIISQEEFDNFKDTGFNAEKIEKVESYFNNDIRSSITTTAKTLSITKDGTIINIKLKWLKNPNVKSLDLIGFRMIGGNLLAIPITFVNSKMVQQSNYKQDGNNFGQIVNISSISNGGYITQQIMYSGSGKIYGSYQHAVKRTTYKIANSYNFKPSGYGDVFEFYGTALKVYDCMQGININF